MTRKPARYIGFSAKDIQCCNAEGNHWNGHWADITKHQGGFVRAQQGKKWVKKKKKLGEKDLKTGKGLTVSV